MRDCNNQMDMIRHEHKFFNLQTRVKIFHGFNLSYNNFTVRRRQRARGVEDAAPYDTAENFCFISGTNRDEIRADCAIIKLRQTVGFSLR